MKNFWRNGLPTFMAKHEAGQKRLARALEASLRSVRRGLAQGFDGGFQ